LEEERTTHVGAERHERVEGRRAHRNGHCTRDLGTTYGPLPKLRIPRLLEGGLDCTLFDKYQRRQTAVDAAIGQLFLQGISTRKLQRIAQDLFGAPVSATTVSKATAVLDGISQKVRDLGVEGKVMLCAFGIRAGGTKALLSFRLADTEDTTSWQGFLVDLKSRGLKGKALTLIPVAGNPALLKALRALYPLRRIQRCLAHKLRNVVVKLKRAQREACMGEAKRFFGAPSRTEAIRRFRAWRTTWLDEAEATVRCLEKDLFPCCHYFRFPKERWKTIRTTNILARAFREVRRRTRPMGVFPNAESAERIMYGVTDHLNTNWQEHPLRQIQQSA